MCNLAYCQHSINWLVCCSTCRQFILAGTTTTVTVALTSKLTTHELVTSQATTQESVTSQATSVSSQATTKEPVTLQATTKEPVTSQATTKEPVTSQATKEHVTSQFTMGEHVTSQTTTQTLMTSEVENTHATTLTNMRTVVSTTTSWLNTSKKATSSPSGTFGITETHDNVTFNLLITSTDACEDQGVAGVLCEDYIAEQGKRACYHVEQQCCSTCKLYINDNNPGKLHTLHYVHV